MRVEADAIVGYSIFNFALGWGVLLALLATSHMFGCIQLIKFFVAVLLIVKY